MNIPAKTRSLCTAVALLCATTSATSASAATLLFQLTGAQTATFQIDSNRTPDTFSSSFIGSQIQYYNVAGTFGGVAGVAPSIGFGTFLAASLNINGTPLGFSQYAGPELFGGPASAPVFNLGTFALSSIVIGQSTLTISQLASGGVPEPATWGMMILGFGLTGFAMRSRRHAVARVTYA